MTPKALLLSLAAVALLTYAAPPPPLAGQQTQAGQIKALDANLANGAPTPNSAVATQLGGVLNALSIGVQGTYSATLVVQVTADNANWVTVPNSSYTKVSDGSTGAIAGAGMWTVPVSGLSARVTASAYASGSAAVSLVPYSAAGSPAAGGGGGGGSVTQGTSPWVTNDTTLDGIVSGGKLPVSLASLPALATGGNAIGSITNTAFIANAGTNLNTSALELDATGQSILTQVTGLGAAISSNKVNVNVSSGAVAATESGTWTVQPGNTANTTPWLANPAPATAGGVTTTYQNGALTNTVVSVKASAGNVYAYGFTNPDATHAATLEIFNTASGSVTLGTTVPIWHMTLQGGQSANLAFPVPLTCGTQISIVAVSAYNGSAAPTTALDVSVAYN